MINVDIVAMVEGVILEKKRITKRQLKKIFPYTENLDDILGFLVSMHKIKIKKLSLIHI